MPAPRQVSGVTRSTQTTGDPKNGFARCSPSVDSSSLTVRGHRSPRNRQDRPSWATRLPGLEHPEPWPLRQRQRTRRASSHAAFLRADRAVLCGSGRYPAPACPMTADGRRRTPPGYGPSAEGEGFEPSVEGFRSMSCTPRCLLSRTATRPRPRRTNVRYYATLADRMRPTELPAESSAGHDDQERATCDRRTETASLREERGRRARCRGGACPRQRVLVLTPWFGRYSLTSSAGAM